MFLFYSLINCPMFEVHEPQLMSNKVPCWFPPPCLTTSVCTGPIVNIFSSTIKGIFMIVVIDYGILSTSRLSKSYPRHGWGFCNFADFL